MSAPSPPPDNSLQVEAMKEQNAQQAQAAQDAKDAQHKQELADLRQGARTAATGTVGDYFNQQGVDPTAYEGSIAYGPGKGHCWSGISEREMMRQMAERVGTAEGGH